MFLRVLGASALAVCAGLPSAAQSLAPRSVPAKPAHAVIPPDHSHQILHLKFAEGTAIRLRDGAFASLRQDDLSGLDRVLSAYPGAVLERLFSRPEEVLEREKRAVETKSLRQQADKNLWYRVRVPAGTDLVRLIDELNALKIVEIAYPEPLPAPPTGTLRNFSPAPEAEVDPEPVPPAPGLVTPDFTGYQAYSTAAPNGIDAIAARDVCGGRGDAVHIIDIEYSWNDQHEDLAAASGGLIANKTAKDPFSSTDHGTAVIGEMIASDNGIGVTGLVPNADFNMVNADNDEDGYDLADSIDVAHSNLGDGDLIIIEQQASGPNGCNNGTSGCVAVEWVQAYYDAIVSATSDGIIVLEAAGNGNENLDDTATYGNPFPSGRADSGAIIVGSANYPGCTTPTHGRIGSSTYGARVNLHAYGECVTTTGYGTLQSGPMNTLYTNTFSGTSSATPIVTSAAAALSSVAETLSNVHLTSAQVRAKLAVNGTAQNTGTGSNSGSIGPMPDLKKVLAEYETEAPDLTCPSSVSQECTSPSGASVTFSVTATDDCDPSPDIDCTHDSGSSFAIGTTPNSCSAKDAVDNQDTCQFNVSVVDTTAPSITCPANVTVECTGSLGIDADDPQLAAFFSGLLASDVCDASLTKGDDAPAFFPLGDTLVTFTATDDHTNSSSCSATVTVADTIPPDITVTLSRDSLWPPNHKMASLTTSVTVTDVCDPSPTFVLTSIASDEPDNGLGDGDQPNDIQGAAYGTADTAFSLRSERAGLGDGREYACTYTASDSSGNTTPNVSVVSVPHSQQGLALGSGGFNAVGTGFGPGATTYRLVVLSTPIFDAQNVDVRDAMIGNSIDVIRWTGYRLVDANGDGRLDLELTYPVAATTVLRSRSTSIDPIGLHYDGASVGDYVVPDIFRLGAPIVVP